MLKGTLVLNRISALKALLRGLLKEALAPPALTPLKAPIVLKALRIVLKETLLLEGTPVLKVPMGEGLLAETVAVMMMMMGLVEGAPTITLAMMVMKPKRRRRRKRRKLHLAKEAEVTGEEKMEKQEGQEEQEEQEEQGDWWRRGRGHWQVVGALKALLLLQLQLLVCD